LAFTIPLVTQRGDAGFNLDGEAYLPGASNALHGARRAAARSVLLYS
jgi:hypothetical protein